MKNITIIKSSVLTIIGLSLIMGSAMARKPGKHRHAKKNDGENAAIKEERILNKKDTHGAQTEEGKDRRSSNIHTYHKQTYTRVKALLKSGKITEAEGSEYKILHTYATENLKNAKKDGTLTKAEIDAIRDELNNINDTLTAIAGKGEIAEERTPLLNKRQHQIEEVVEAGIKSGRLSTLEASGIKRKLARLTSLEDRLKKDNEVSTKERKKLFKEVGEISREIYKELRD